MTFSQYDLDELECDELPVTFNDGRAFDDIEAIPDALDTFALLTCEL